MGNTSGSTSPCEYTVSRSCENDQNGKIRSQKESKLSKTGKNRPKTQKSPPQIQHFEACLDFRANDRLPGTLSWGLRTAQNVLFYLRFQTVSRPQNSEYDFGRLASNALLAWAELCSRLQLGGCQTGYNQSTTWTLELSVERCGYENVGGATSDSTGPGDEARYFDLDTSHSPGQS
jgi:hypothetical protein